MLPVSGKEESIKSGAAVAIDIMADAEAIEVSTSSICMMECGCCFADANLEDMVQCGDGHLFCQDCLRRYASEAVHGQGQVTPQKSHRQYFHLFEQPTIHINFI